MAGYMRRPGCGLCRDNEVMDIVGFYGNVGVKVIEDRLFVFPQSAGATSMYTMEVPIQFCPFCGRKVQPNYVEFIVDGCSKPIKVSKK